MNGVIFFNLYILITFLDSDFSVYSRLNNRIIDPSQFENALSKLDRIEPTSATKCKPTTVPATRQQQSATSTTWHDEFEQTVSAITAITNAKYDCKPSCALTSIDQASNPVSSHEATFNQFKSIPSFR